MLTWLIIAAASAATPEERLDAIEANFEATAARIVVAHWSDRDHLDDVHVKKAKLWIARPDAKAVPMSDLAHATGPNDDWTTRSETTLASLRLPEAPAIPDEVQTPEGDVELSEAPQPIDMAGQRAAVAALIEECGFIDREELRSPLFQLHLWAGLLADRADDLATRDLHWNSARELAAADSKLLELAGTHRAEFQAFADSAGALPELLLDFDAHNNFAPYVFAGIYQVRINGLETLITDPGGELRVAGDHADIVLTHNTGHVTSFTATDARLGLDEVEATFQEPLRALYSTQPKADLLPLEGDLLAAIQAYDDAHDGEFYLVLPDLKKSKKISVWRYKSSTLVRL